MIAHEEVQEPLFDFPDRYKILLPQQLGMVTYPYEWCFGQLKDAALLTLAIMKSSLQHGMILKDASSFNVQFIHSKPVFIDTLSFEVYKEGQPWKAYKQFCEMFLAPLAVMSYTGRFFQRSMLSYPEGIPLASAVRLLPFRSKLNTGLLLHIHLHAWIKKSRGKNNEVVLSKTKLIAIIDSLERTITKLKPGDTPSTWGNYYSGPVLSKAYLAEKEKIIDQLLSVSNPATVLDIGANDGYFSEIAAKHAAKVIAIDQEAGLIDRLFAKQKNIESSIDVLVADIANPSPAMGALLRERMSLLERARADVVLALAVVHHLVITHHFSFEMAAELFAGLGETLIIEFPLETDEKVQLIGAHVHDLASVYNIEKFKEAFEIYFELDREIQLQSAQRVIFQLKKRSV